MIGRIKEDLEQTPMTFNEKRERKFGAIQTFSDIGLSSVRIGIIPVKMGIKSIRFMKDRIKEFEDRLWGTGYL